jgi:hypothetical protein
MVDLQLHEDESDPESGELAAGSPVSGEGFNL